MLLERHAHSDFIHHCVPPVLVVRVDGEGFIEEGCS